MRNIEERGRIPIEIYRIIYLFLAHEILISHSYVIVFLMKALSYTFGKRNSSINCLVKPCLPVLTYSSTEIFHSWSLCRNPCLSPKFSSAFTILYHHLHPPHLCFSLSLSYTFCTFVVYSFFLLSCIILEHFPSRGKRV